jgi:hypothetical protein
MKKLILIVLICSCVVSVKSQENRIIYNGKPVFLSGMNLAWIHFSKDLTRFDKKEFTRALDEIANAGGNSMRWWLHIDGTHSPEFFSDSVSGISPKELANLNEALDLAKDRNIGIIMCLWSFDMLRKSIGEKYTERNMLLLQNEIYTKAYIHNALLPMLDAVGKHPAIICWEIFNEPEGMSNEFGWDFNEHVPMHDIQRFINLTAGAIHRRIPGALVSNGSWSFHAATDVDSNMNYYTDKRLIEAGGDDTGILDFYMVHYYDWAKARRSPFHHPASYWALDKPLVVAEFSAKGPIEGIDPKSAYEYLYNNGYAGALSWTWTNHDGNGGVKEATPGMKSLREKFPESIRIDFKK